MGEAAESARAREATLRYQAGPEGCGRKRAGKKLKGTNPARAEAQAGAGGRRGISALDEVFETDIVKRL